MRAGSPTARANEPKTALTLGQRIADQVAATTGSWPFIMGESLILLTSILLHVTAFIQN